MSITVSNSHPTIGMLPKVNVYNLSIPSLLLKAHESPKAALLLLWLWTRTDWTGEKNATEPPWPWSSPAIHIQPCAVCTGCTTCAMLICNYALFSATQKHVFTPYTTDTAYCYRLTNVTGLWQTLLLSLAPFQHSTKKTCHDSIFPTE